MTKITPATGGSLLERCMGAQMARNAIESRHPRKIDLASLAVAFTGGCIAGMILTILVIIR